MFNSPTGRNTAPRPAARRGQVLAGIIILLLILSILVPLLVNVAMQESKWTDKQARNTTALHLAEAGIEKGYLALSLSTNTWYQLITYGTSIPDYRGDKKYSDVAGGDYAISITSGPLADQATIISMGRDNRNREIRAIKSVYTNAPMGGVAIYSGNGVQIAGGVNVEWGAVITPQTLDPGGRTYPQFWSASQIIGAGFDQNPNPPNCDQPDCCQWHSFVANLPPQPTIDLNFYRSSAVITGTRFTGPLTWTNTTDGSGHTYFIDGDLTIKSPGIDINGNLIVTGNLSTQSGNWGRGNRIMKMPTTAWKQYCNAWAHYQTFDSALASFPGISASYAPTGITETSGKVAVSGLLYVGGSFTTGGGGGNTDVYGTMLVVGSSTMTNNSGVTIYFNEEASKNVQWTRISLSRVSWQDYLSSWPAGL
jgi:hypothetical protein